MYLIYTVANIKILMALFSGSTERNLTKLGQCGEGMSTKKCAQFGLNQTSGTSFFSPPKKLYVHVKVSWQPDLVLVLCKEIGSVFFSYSI